MRTITVVTATRAEYGLLRPVVQKIAASDVLDLQLVVTGAHLCPRLGETVHEIEADGLPIAARLPIFTDNADEPVAKTIARTMEIFDNHFAAHRPDAVLLLGDRFEIFAVAAAAAARHIPIAHISGGDVTLGAADEYYRHCISKMAAVHFPSCADSAARLVRMGEAPDTVFCVGGLGDENIRTLPKMSREELCKSTGFDLMQPFALVTYHPETAPDAGSPAVQVQALCDAMAAVDGVFWLITGSNADAGGQVCTAMMQTFAAAHPDRLAHVRQNGLYILKCLLVTSNHHSQGSRDGHGVSAADRGIQQIHTGSNGLFMHLLNDVRRRGGQVHDHISGLAQVDGLLDGVLDDLMGGQDLQDHVTGLIDLPDVGHGNAACLLKRMHLLFHHIKALHRAAGFFDHIFGHGQAHDTHADKSYRSQILILLYCTGRTFHQERPP